MKIYLIRNYYNILSKELLGLIDYSDIFVLVFIFSL